MLIQSRTIGKVGKFFPYSSNEKMKKNKHAPKKCYTSIPFLYICVLGIFLYSYITVSQTIYFFLKKIIRPVKKFLSYFSYSAKKTAFPLDKNSRKASVRGFPTFPIVPQKNRIPTRQKIVGKPLFEGFLLFTFSYLFSRCGRKLFSGRDRLGRLFESECLSSNRQGYSRFR